MYVHCAYPFLIYYIYIYRIVSLAGTISWSCRRWWSFLTFSQTRWLRSTRLEGATEASKSLEDRGQRERFVLELISGCAGIAIPEVRAAPAVARTESQDNLKAAGTKSYSHSLFPSPLTRAHKCESVYTNRNYLTPNVWTLLKHVSEYVFLLTGSYFLLERRVRVHVTRYRSVLISTSPRVLNAPRVNTSDTVPDTSVIL